MEMTETGTAFNIEYGLRNDRRTLRKALFGDNVIGIEDKGVFRLLVDEVPFFSFFFFLSFAASF